MDNFTFWKNWNNEYKFFFFFSFCLLIGSAIFLIITSQLGLDFTQGWGSIEELTTIPIEFQKFTNHYHEFKIEAINYLIYEKYTSTIAELNPTIGLIYIFFLFTGFTLLLTFSTTLSKYLYYGSVLASLLFLATLNLDLLEILDSKNKIILSACVILYGGISYAIYNFWYDLRLSQRFYIFLGLNAILLLSVFTLSPLESNVITYHLAGYSSASTVVLIGLFLLYLGIEISLFIVFLNSNNRNGNYGIYLLINLMYLGILIAKLFYRFEISGINEYSLVITSTLLSVWGTLKRNEDNKRGDTIARVFVSIILSSLVLSTLAFHSANQNSPLLLAFERLIYISFLGFGGIFFIYVIFNFGGHIRQKINVYRIIFKPNDFTAFRMYMFSIIACLALMSYKYQGRVYYQAIASYYNSVADSYYMKGDLFLAEPYYQFAKNNAPFNNRSNIALANVHLKKENLPLAIEHYKYATIAGGNEQAYIQLANIYNNKGDYFDALSTLKKGLKKHPNSYKLWNNLGILSKKSNLSDSTVSYFSKSIDFAPGDDKTPINNLITYLIKKDFDKEAKELIESFSDDDLDQTTKAAIAAYNAKNGVLNQWNKVDFNVDSNLTNSDLAYLYNHFIDNIAKMDSNDLKVLDSTLEAPQNIFNYEPITTLKAFYEFYNGDPITAKEHMATLGGGTSFYSGYYNQTLGTWLLMHENYLLANKYFTIADKYNFKGGKFNHGFTETILKNSAADSIWIEIGNAGKDYLNIAKSNFDSISDFHKLFALSIGKQEMYDEFINSTSDKNIIKLMKIERIKHLITQNKIDDANVIFNEIKSTDDLQLESTIKLIEAELLIAQNKNNDALKLLSETQFPIELNAKFFLLSAIASENIGDSTQAEKIYKTLVYKYPYFEPGLIQFGEYMRKKGKTSEAYNIIVQGVKALPNSTELGKIYTLLCLDESLTKYAEESMLELKNQLSAEEFNAFNSIYQEKLASLEEQFSQWEE